MRWLILVMFMLPTAQAVDLQYASDNDMPLLPGQRALGELHVMLNCDEVISELAFPSVDVALSAKHSSLVQTSLPDMVTIETAPCLARAATVTGSVDVEASLHWESAALDIQQVALEAEAPWTTAVLHVPYRAAYVPHVTVEVVKSVQEAGPQKQILYELALTNHGNGLTRIHWEHVTTDLQGMVVLPDDLILEPEWEDQATNSAHVVYVTPFENGDNDVEEPFSIKLWPSFALDDDLRGEAIQVDLQANTKGVYVPGPAALLPLALVGAAFLRRRL